MLAEILLFYERSSATATQDGVYLQCSMGNAPSCFFRSKSDAHAWMSSLHQDLTDQFWQGLTVQERQIIMITHQNGIVCPAPSLNPRRVDDAFHAFLEIKQHQHLRPKFLPHNFKKFEF